MMRIWAMAGALAAILPTLCATSARAEDLEAKELREYIRLSERDFPMNRAPAREMPRTERTSSEPAPGETDLCGEWTLVREGIDPIPYAVPGSIHVALMRAGIIPDPNFGTNAILARLESTEHDWSASRTFDWTPSADSDARDELVFSGVCDRCEVTLNGERLGTHQGMFGGPVFDVTGKLKPKGNRLEVRLLRALPYTETVVFCCSYGWHYSQVVPLGIWQPVAVRRRRAARLDSPFIATVGAKDGRMSLYVKIDGAVSAAAVVEATVTPKNFAGAACTFAAAPAGSETRFDLRIPSPRLWWPHGYGDQPLYRLRTRLLDAGGRVLDEETSSFGVREIAYEHTPAHPDFYRTLVSVNGRRIFRHGANWCTMDALMRFTRENYRRFLVRAREQGVNWLRAWGNGAVETREFYDLCDEMGFLVMQEWPTSNNSHRTQPGDVLEETARLSTKRLRNHPSLIMWNGGNESIIEPDDEIIYRRLGRPTYLNDGTRPYYRQEENRSAPGHAIVHSHIRWLGRYPEHYLEKYGSTPNSLGEWGADTLMNVESIAKVVTPEDLARWPVDPDGPVAYRTAMFNHFNAIWHLQDGTGAAGRTYTPPSIRDRYTGETVPDSDMNVARAYARTFFAESEMTNLATLVRGSQLAQAMATGPMIGNLRSFWPDVPAYSYYKLNDIGPNGSWSHVDWFGSPKIAYWWAKSFMAPCLAAVRLPTFDFWNKRDSRWTIPVRLVDDRGILPSGASAEVRVYDAAFAMTACVRGGRAFDLVVDRGQIANGLRFLVAEVRDGARVVSRTWTPLNYDKVRGSLFRAARTHLAIADDGKGRIRIRNAGTVPAVGVELSCPAHSEMLHLSDNWFWLERGEERTVEYSFEDGVFRPLEPVRALNLAAKGELKEEMR